MKTSLFDYTLPSERIAQHPPVLRGSTRLLVYDKGSGISAHKKYSDIPSFIEKGDVVVFNRTKVVKARVHTMNTRNNKHVEVLFVEFNEKVSAKELQSDSPQERWKCLVGRARDVADGDVLVVGDSRIRILHRIHGERYFLVEVADGFSLMEREGTVPLPPYIKRKATKSDVKRYNTVFARTPKSVAAPTSSLNVTKSLLDAIVKKGARIVYVDLAVGLGTFLPVVSDEIEQHVMHSEWAHVNRDVVDAVNNAEGRVWAFGTTVVRSLETAAVGKKRVSTFEGYTDLFIYPGYEFNVVDVMVTNFHMPRSTLIMLVSAFTGIDAVKELYEEALCKRYRFLSYGDSMMAGNFPKLTNN